MVDWCGVGEVHADRCGGAVLGGVQGRIRRVEVGIERDRSGGKFRNPDVAVSVDAGAGSLHVRDRTVENGPRMVR